MGENERWVGILHVYCKSISTAPVQVDLAGPIPELVQSYKLTVSVLYMYVCSSEIKDLCKARY